MSTKQATTHEPTPMRNGSKPIWELVIEDMHARDGEGRRKYGTPLQAGNGRDALVDAYQEALDLVVYLRQEIEERNSISWLATVPVMFLETGFVVVGNISEDVIRKSFDSTGLGSVEWSGWAICNGNNGTPDMVNRGRLAGK